MIDTEALRKKVINLAIQGKLTEQLPGDGDAETLYALIQDHKSQLIGEGKIKKDKDLPNISADEIPFETPKNWKWVRFGELMWNRDSERIPVSVEDRKKLKKTYDYYGASGVIDKVEDYLFDTKLLLIGEDGANLLSRSTPIAFLADGKYWVNNHAHVLGFYLYDYLDFVMYYINSISLVPYVTGAAQPKLNQDNMNKIPVPLAPIPEQKRIVEKIEEVLSQIDIIDDLQSKYSNDLAVLKSKIIDAGIRGKLTEQLPEDGNAEDLYAQIQKEKVKLIKEGKIKKEKPLPEITEDEIPFEISRNWKWVRLGDVASVYGGKRIPAGRSLTTENTGHKYIRVSDMKNGTVITDNLLYVPEDIYPTISKYIINKEDVYITVAGTIGKVGKIPPEIDGVNLTENADRIVFDFLNQDWLLWCLSASMIQKQIEQLTTQVAQPKLAIKRIQEFMLPMPPLAEQKRISSKIIEVFEMLS